MRSDRPKDCKYLLPAALSYPCPNCNCGEIDRLATPEKTWDIEEDAKECARRFGLMPEMTGTTAMLQRLEDARRDGVFNAYRDGGSFAEDIEATLSLAREAAEFRDFVEQIAGGCIPDYEEAKRDAQHLLRPKD